MRKESFIVISFLVLINAGIVCGSNEILLKSRSFVRERGINADTREVIEAIPGRAHVLIQLEHIQTIAERKEFEAKGIKLLSYIPNKAWFASIASDKAVQIAALANVRAIIEILPEDKISSHIIAGKFFEKRVKEGKLDLIVEFFKDVSLEEAELVIMNHRGYVVGRVSRLNAFVVTVEKEECINLAFEEKVKWVEQELPLEEFNDGIRTAIGVDIVQDPPLTILTEPT
jgi:hypothetical protein